MYIKCWGSRGSIPVSGKEYLEFGGDTTCIQVTAQSGETVILDAGTGMRKFGLAHNTTDKSTYYLLMTHLHWDHIAGFTFFKPFLDDNCTVIIQNHKFANHYVKDILDSLMMIPLFPIAMKDFRADIRFTDKLKGCFSIGSLDIETIPLSHPNEGFGYKFTENGRSFVFLTDNELGFDHPGCATLNDYEAFCTDVDLLIHDAEFTPEEYPSRIGWGHSSYADVLDLSIKASVKKIGLFHINQEREDKQVYRFEGQCRDYLKKKNSSIDSFAVATGMDFTL